MSRRPRRPTCDPTLFSVSPLFLSPPTVSTRTGYAAAVGEAKGPEAGLAVLDAIDPGSVSGYQPYWAVRAHLLQRLAMTSEAADAFDRAIGLAEDPAVRQFLLQRRG
jgi:RNA polymerase sigma-70 factor (ECF subfamily)